MSDSARVLPSWFRIVAGLLILWGLMGCFSCLQYVRLGAEAMGPATEYDRALIRALPLWYDAIYIVAVGCGLAGSIALWRRSVVAVPLYLFSLLAVLIQFGWYLLTTDVIAVKGTWVTYFPAFIIAVAVFQVWLARRAKARGWIG